jgi:hypothetical protein
MIINFVFLVFSLISGIRLYNRKLNELRRTVPQILVENAQKIMKPFISPIFGEKPRNIENLF